MTVGEKIKKLRLERGLTQEELGDVLGVKKAAVQKYESGQVQNLKQSTIKKLCEVFNKYPDYFIFDDFDNDLEAQLRKEVEFVQIIEKKYGKEVVGIFEIVIELNDDSKKKVSDYVNDIAFIQSVKCKDEV